MTRLLAASMTAAALLGASAVAHAAPIATLTCTTNSTTLSAKLSYYNLSGDFPTTTTGTTGAGAGKITLNPLVVHAALSQVASFYTPFLSGTTIPSCTLSSSAGGANFTIKLTNVFINSVTATATGASTATGGSTTPDAYVSASFSFGKVEVESGGVDDGGTTSTTTTNKGS